MLEIKLSQDKVINEENTRIILSDGTGNYGDIHYEKDPEDSTKYIQVVNETGYGAPNETRESLALFIIGKKLGVTHDTFLEFDSYSPISDSSWNAIIKDDGVYQFWLIKAIPALNPVPINYEERDVVYDQVERKLYRVEGEEFVKVQLSDLINTAASSPSVKFPHLAKAGSLFSNLVAKRTDLLMRNCHEKEVTLATKAIDDIEGGAYSMNYEFCKGNIINAVKIAEYLNNKDYTNVLNL